MVSKIESKTSALSDRLTALEGQHHDPDEFRDFALRFLLVSEVVVLADPDARTQAVKAGIERQASGIDPATLHRIERQLKPTYPHDQNRFSADEAVRLAANVRLASWLRAAVAEYFD